MTKITMVNGREFIVADNYERVKTYVKCDQWLEIEVTEIKDTPHESYLITSNHMVAVKHIVMITKLPHKREKNELTND